MESSEIDPVRYGAMWQRVQDYERRFEVIDKKLDKMERQIEELLALANKGKGGFWMGMTIASMAGGGTSRGDNVVDPLTALAAISSAVQLVKKVSKTVDDVASLGPVLGKYFDAKEQAIEVVKQAKSGGFKGSALGKALELEMALESAREFEEQVKMLFFQSNKMDVWQRITARAKQMEIDAAHDARRKKEAAKRREAEIEEAIILVIGLTVGGAAIAVTIWAVVTGFNW
jgi:hypothetical protein